MSFGATPDDSAKPLSATTDRISAAEDSFASRAIEPKGRKRVHRTNSLRTA